MRRRDGDQRKFLPTIADVQLRSMGFWTGFMCLCVWGAVQKIEHMHDPASLSRLSKLKMNFRRETTKLNQVPPNTPNPFDAIC